MAEFVDYEVWLGSFHGETFVWKSLKKFNDFESAYKFYHEYSNKQMTYNDDELKKIWGSARIDVELRQGKKIINWVGIYSRRVAKPDEVYKSKEEVEAESKE